MTLPKFLLSGISTITILLIGVPLVLWYPQLKREKATGLAAIAGAMTSAIFTPQFWVSAVLLLLFFWYTSQLNSKVLRAVLFWIPAGAFYVTAVMIKFFGEAMPYNISSTIVNLSIQNIFFFLTIVAIGLAVICRSSHLAGELVIGFSYLFLLFSLYKASRVEVL